MPLTPDGVPPWELGRYWERRMLLLWQRSLAEMRPNTPASFHRYERFGESRTASHHPAPHPPEERSR